MSILTQQGNINYAAQVVVVPEGKKAPNSDRLYTFDVLGTTVVGDKSWVERVGETAVLFFAESQIASEVASKLNLYRHSELNADPTETGYLEDNRRVRAIRLRGTPSYGLMVPLEKFAAALGVSESEFAPGIAFDHVGEAEIVRKYETPLTRAQRQQTQAQKVMKRVTNEQMPEHYDTKHFLRYLDEINPYDQLIVTQKLHGSSVRLGHVKAYRTPTRLERVLVYLGIAEYV